MRCLHHRGTGDKHPVSQPIRGGGIFRRLDICIQRLLRLSILIPQAPERDLDSTTRRQNVAQLRWSCFRRGINGSHSASVWRSVRLPRWTWVRPLDYSPENAENADIAGGDRCSHSHLAKTLPKLARVRQRAQPSHEFPGQGRHAARSTLPFLGLRYCRYPLSKRPGLCGEACEACACMSACPGQRQRREAQKKKNIMRDVKFGVSCLLILTSSLGLESTLPSGHGATKVI